MTSEMLRMASWFLHHAYRAVLLRIPLNLNSCSDGL
jgi:hypothetical protein